jgi:hypothetical protein
MRQNLFLGELKPSVFIERLKRMNKFLKYFPRADLSLGEDKLLIGEEQLITIVHHASHGIMQLQIQRAGRTINEFKTLDDLKVIFEQQYECDMLEKRILKRDDDEKEHKKAKKATKKKKHKAKNDDDEADKSGKGDRKPPAKPTCSKCGKVGHRNENCWTLEKNAKKRPASFQTTNSILKKSKHANKSPSSKTKAFFTEEQVSVMMGQVMASMKEKYGGNKKPKRQVQFSDSSDSDSDSIDKKTKAKNIPYSFIYTYLFDYDRTMEAPAYKRENQA